MIRLLDVNILVALIDPGHPFHVPAHSWFAANRDAGWATCPITENGVVRILSGPQYAGVPQLLSEVFASVLSLRQVADMSSGRTISVFSMQLWFRPPNYALHAK